jgi:hypothetical protein
MTPESPAPKVSRTTIFNNWRGNNDGKRPAAAAPKLQARILAWTQQRQPSDGSTHWSTRKLGKKLGVSHVMVARVSSWLNRVELWLNRIERDVIAGGVFTSVADLRRKLMRYIRHYHKAPKPIKWVYRDPSRRITTDSTVTCDLGRFR